MRCQPACYFLDMECVRCADQAVPGMTQCQRHREMQNAAMRRYARAGYHLKSRLPRLYGITMERFREMLEAQNYACAGCRKPQDELGYRLCVDHCHDTGRVRWLLCQPCNKTFGRGDKEQVERMLALVGLAQNGL